MPPSNKQNLTIPKPNPRTRTLTRSPEYAGKRTKTGNSTGFRFEQALFRSHPEFSGDVRAHVIAPGRLLITAEPAAVPENDPVFDAFLAFLTEDMTVHPERIKPLDPRLLQQIASLTQGVGTNMDEDLGDETLI